VVVVKNLYNTLNRANKYVLTKRLKHSTLIADSQVKSGRDGTYTETNSPEAPQHRTGMGWGVESCLIVSYWCVSA